MISNKQAKSYVEKMIKEFYVNPEFQNAMCWLTEEMNKIYTDKLRDLQKRIDFYRTFSNDPISLEKHHHKMFKEITNNVGCSSLIAFGIKTFSSRLFEVCFTNLDKTWDEVLKSY